MTTLRRLFPAALAATSLAAGAAPAGAALNPVFGDSTPLTSDTGTRLATKESVATSHGRVVAMYLEGVGATGSVKAVRLDAPSGSWTAAETLSDPGADVEDHSPRIVADSDGNMTAVWRDENDGSLHARTLLKDAPEWSADEQISGADNGTAATLEPGADGTVVVAWGRAGADRAFTVRTRAAGSASWQPAVNALDTGSNYPGEPTLDVNAAGDAVLFGEVTDGATSKQLLAARYDHQTATWTPAAAPVDSYTSSYYLSFSDVALAPDGSALAVWVDPAPQVWAPVAVARSSYSAPGSSSWAAPEAITEAGQHALLTRVVADRSSNFVTSFQSVIDDSSDMLAQIGSSRGITRTRSAATGSWSAPEMLMGDRYGGAGALNVDADYNIAVVLLSTDSLDLSRMGDQAVAGANLAVVYRPDGEQEFGAADTIFTGDISVNGSMPHVTLDEHGNPVAAFMEAMASTNNRLRVAVGDASGPELRDLSVPASGTVGEPVTFSVNPFDPLSGVDATSWSFGEGADATGSTVTRAYETPGTYTVTVSASDLNGLVSTETRTITIAAQPVDEPDTTPETPKVLAPVIEARLSGKTITLTARVTLRAGKKCSGKATATTRFGTTTYRTTLKLATVNGKCVGTGKIKLKKTPSTRTKLRVTISAKTIKTRTVTTKRA